MEKEQQGGKKVKWFRNGLFFGAIVGSLFVISNKKTRTKLVAGVGNCTEKTKDWYTFVKENQEPFLEQLRATSGKIATIVEEASDDIQTLMETSQHIKEHTMSLVSALQETKDEFRTLAARLKNNVNDDVENILPSSIDETDGESGKILQ